jgi:phage terminase large subunit-like protein
MSYLALAEIFKQSLYQFYTEIAWPALAQDKYIDNWHIHEIAKVLRRYKDAIVNREHISDLIINVPPGSSKSSLISQTFPVWLWLHDPKICTIVSSYSNGLSTDHSIKAKSIINSDAFQEIFQDYFQAKHGAKLRFAKDNEGYWINNFGGQYVVTSTGGTVTGRHAHLIIRDDPESPEHSYSDSYRARAQRFNDRTLSTRKKNKDATPTVTVMQRLHEEDTTGHELKKDKELTHICLPAELSDKVVPVDFRAFYINGLLDPNRMNRTVLEAQREDLGTFAYSGQFSQEPYPEEGGKIKKDWFCFMDEGDISEGMVWDVWIDGAYTDKTANDPTGIMICAHDIRNNRIVIRHCESDYLKLPDLIKRLVALEHGVDGASMYRIEPKASGYSIIQVLQDEEYLNVEKITGKLVTVGKEARLNVSSPKIEGSRVWLVNGNWNSELIKQHTGFPTVSHDEYVDLLGYACWYYFK